MTVVHVHRRLAIGLLLAGAGFGLLGCGDGGESLARQVVEEDSPAVRAMLRRDVDRTQAGVVRAADRLSRGFLVEDPAQRERDIRWALRHLQEPPRGFAELMLSPISFLAAVGADGIVIARDSEPDPMRGFDLGSSVPVVQHALEDGIASWALSQIPSTDPDEPPSDTIVFAAPSREDGVIVGAIVAGLPLWRMSQRMSTQLQLEHPVDTGLILWAVLYRGAELHHHGSFPPDLLELVPDEGARTAGLANSPGGYTGQARQFGRNYAFGVLPLPTLGPDVGLVLFRSPPN